MIKVLVALGGIILISVIAYLVWPQLESETSSPAASQSNQTVDTNTDTQLLIIGDTNAPATVTEYGDFKCPNCAKFHVTTGQGIRQDYVETGSVRVVFRNVALIGPDSERAAQGAYCANEQKKFAQYHDAVYEYMWENYYQNGNYRAEFEDVLTENLLAETVKSIGGDSQKFVDCLRSEKYAVATQADLDAAAEDEVRGTPTFVIGEQTITGPQPYSVFQTIIDLQLQ